MIKRKRRDWIKIYGSTFMDRRYKEKTTNISISILSIQISLLTMSAQCSSEPFFNPTPIPKKHIH